MGAKFRKIAGEKLCLWAETKPDVIWIDDDIRFHNHRTSIDDLWEGKIPSERLDFGCFCEKHIKLFNKSKNTNYTRDEIVRGIISGEKHNEIRKQWLDFSGKCADEFADWIKRTIHDVSKETRVAVMTSLPEVHSVEGRNWNTFLRNLSGNGKPLLRPTFGPYAEKNPCDFFSSYLVVEQLKANIKLQYDGAFDFCPEIENTRFTRWSKSLAATGYQIMLSAFMGCKGITLSIYDLEGCVLAEEPEFGLLLRNKKTLIDRLAKYDLWEWESEGVGLFTAPDRIAASHNESCVSEMHQLSSGRLWDETLLKAGIPCKYITADRLDSCIGIALDWHTVNQLTDDELRQLLSKGVLLDAGAAAVLNRRGFSDYIGVTVGEKVKCIAATEILHGYKHKDGSAVRIPARIDGLKWNQLILNGAKEISTLVTPYGTIYPGFTQYKNPLGGTVYVYAGNDALGDGFFSNYRIAMLKDICRSITQESICEINNPSYALLCVKSRGNERAAFISNMSADKIEEFIIEIPHKAKTAVVLDCSGGEHAMNIEGNRICCREVNLHLYDALICKWTV